MTIDDCVKYYATRLPSASSKLDIDVILSHVLRCDRSYLRAHGDEELPKEKMAEIFSLLDRRVHGEPVAYIVENKEFYSLPLYVNADVLIPRADTEIVVDAVLSRVNATSAVRVLDVGTGSGAIALALQSQRPQWIVTASDHSDAALAVARRNATQLSLPVTFVKSDWFFQIPLQAFDVIVSNPPYIEFNDPHLSEGDVRFEPLMALAAMQQGLADLDVVIDHAKEYLVEGGLLAVEHGASQATAVTQLFHAAKFSRVETINDIENRPRVTLGYA